MHKSSVLIMFHALVDFVSNDPSVQNWFLVFTFMHVFLCTKLISNYTCSSIRTTFAYGVTVWEWCRSIIFSSFPLQLVFKTTFWLATDESRPFMCSPHEGKAFRFAQLFSSTPLYQKLCSSKFLLMSLPHALSNIQQPALQNEYFIPHSPAACSTYTRPTRIPTHSPHKYRYLQPTQGSTWVLEPCLHCVLQTFSNVNLTTSTKII